MKKICPQCGNEFEVQNPTKIYCSPRCRDLAMYSRDESFYTYAPERTNPLYTFECAECGKEVKVYSRYDKRIKFCCGICADKYRRRRENERLKRKYVSKKAAKKGEA